LYARIKPTKYKRKSGCNPTYEILVVTPDFYREILFLIQNYLILKFFILLGFCVLD